MAMKVGDSTYIYLGNAISGIYYGIDNSCDIINMSWQTLSNYSPLQTALQSAWNTNIVLTAAAGNDTLGRKWYPGGYSDVIGVAALNQNDTKRWSSTWGSWVNVSAPYFNYWPIYDIFDTTNPHKYSSGGATSTAAPFVAGLAALIKSVNPNLTNEEIRDIIYNTCDDIDDENPGYEGELGSGRINAYKALSAAKPPETPQNFAIQSVQAVGGENPKLTWSANTEVDLAGYKIERKINDGGWSLKATVSSSTTQYTDRSIIRSSSGNNDYAYYRMYAYDDADLSSDYTGTLSYLYDSDNVPQSIEQITKTYDIELLPTDFALMQNSPNPFNPSSEISFALPEASKVVLEVYNISGEKVTVLINGIVNQGYHTTTFDGSKLASSIYIYKATFKGLSTGKTFSATKRMLLVK
jgi:hypothetical protein